MTTSASTIYNTLTWQEKIVLVFVSSLFILQPYELLNKVCVYALAVIGIWILVFHKQIYRQAGFLQFAAVMALLGLPSIFSLYNTHDLEQTTKIAFGVPLFFVAGTTVYSLLCNRKATRILATIIALTSIIWIVDGLVQFVMGKDIIGIPLYHGRVTGPFNENTHMGILLTVMLPVTLKWFKKYGWFPQLMYITCLGLVIVLTGTRTAWVTYLVALPLFFLLEKRSRRFMLFIVVPAIAIVVVLLSTSSSASKRIDSFTSFPTTYEGWNNKLSNRLYIYETALNMGVKNPITGVGAKAFDSSFAEYKIDRGKKRPKYKSGGPHHVHHPWISTFAETGLIGIISLVGVVVLLFLATIRSPKGFNLYNYPWLLSFVLILNPINSMPPLLKMWWIPIVLLVIISHIVDLEYENKNTSFSKEL